MLESIKADSIKLQSLTFKANAVKYSGLTFYYISSVSCALSSDEVLRSPTFEKSENGHCKAQTLHLDPSTQIVTVAADSSLTKIKLKTARTANEAVLEYNPGKSKASQEIEH